MYLAYLDPGSGSQLAMAIVAGFAGLMVALKVWWRRVLGLFRRKPAEAQQAEEQAIADAAAPASADTQAPASADREQ